MKCCTLVSLGMWILFHSLCSKSKVLFACFFLRGIYSFLNRPFTFAEKQTLLVGQLYNSKSFLYEFCWIESCRNSKLVL